MPAAKSTSKKAAAKRPTRKTAAATASKKTTASRTTKKAVPKTTDNPQKAVLVKSATVKKTTTKTSVTKSVTKAKTNTTKTVAKSKAAVKKPANVRSSTKAKPEQATKSAAHEKTVKAVASDAVMQADITKSKQAKKAASPKKSTQTKAVVPPKTHEKPKGEPPMQTKEPEPPVGSGFMGIPPYQIRSDEPYMNELQKAHFQHILLTWRRALVEELSRTVSQMKDEVINFPDLSDRATLEEEFSLELRTRDRERKLIKKIDEALNHIQEDVYGYCEVCGIEIGIRRLEARPTATQCIDCKTLDEMKERQLRG